VLTKGRRWFLGVSAATALVPIVALLGLYVSCWVNQRKAEKLFSRVFALRVGESTFDEAQALWKEYGSLPGFSDQKCDRSECTFEIARWNFVSEHRIDWKVLRALGIKPDLAYATLTIANGKLSNTEFNLLYESEIGFMVVARVDSVESFSPKFLCGYLSLQRHPTYVVSRAHRSGGIFGEEIEVSLAPGAPESARKLAQAINWNCMTAVFACEGFSRDMTKGLQAIMPAAYAEFLRDREWENDKRFQDYPQLVRDCHVAPLLGAK